MSHYIRYDTITVAPRSRAKENVLPIEEKGCFHYDTGKLFVWIVKLNIIAVNFNEKEQSLMNSHKLFNTWVPIKSDEIVSKTQRSFLPIAVRTPQNRMKGVRQLNVGSSWRLLLRVIAFILVGSETLVNNYSLAVLCLLFIPHWYSFFLIGLRFRTGHMSVLFVKL